MAEQQRLFAKQRIVGTPSFDAAISVYPKRGGPESKRDALRQWLARMREGVEEEEMLEGAGRYRKFCDAMETTGSPYVMQAQRFFGRGRYFEAEYLIPKERPRIAEKRTRTYRPPCGKTFTVEKLQRIHWNTPEEIRAGAKCGYCFPNGTICLAPGGKWL